MREIAASQILDDSVLRGEHVLSEGDIGLVIVFLKSEVRTITDSGSTAAVKPEGCEMTHHLFSEAAVIKTTNKRNRPQKPSSGYKGWHSKMLRNTK